MAPMTAPRHRSRPFAAVAPRLPELLLVSRRHVDLLRVASAGCCRAR
ncbi:putative leader peptide [Pseudofrankia inefficax]